MKKVIFLLAVALCFVGFESKAQTMKYPFGSSSTITIGAGATNNFTITNTMNIVSSVTTLTANTTVSLTVNSQIKSGAMLFLAIKTNASETTTFAGSIEAPVVTGSAGKTWTQAFIYNGTKFYPCGAKIQID